MLKTIRFIRNTKHTLWMCVILFALSPCIIKEALSGSANVAYTKPLNKAKTTTQIFSCQYNQNEIQQISSVKQTKVTNQIEPVAFSPNQRFEVRSAKIHDKYSKTFLGNSPPKYILYKRLKLDIA